MFSYRESHLGRYGLIVFFAALLIYAFFESRAMLFGPAIELENETITTNESLITIRGNAKNSIEVRLNGMPIPITEDGAFEEKYLVPPGVTFIVVDARDKYGRTQQKTIHVAYIIPEETILPSSTTATSTPEVAPEE